MKYRQLGKWGIRLSEVGFGSWLTFNDGDQDLADTLHRVAYEHGINFFDTANAYGRGRTEVMVGKALAPYRRDTYVLATKLFWPVNSRWPRRKAPRMDPISSSAAFAGAVPGAIPAKRFNVSMRR